MRNTHQHEHIIAWETAIRGLNKNVHQNDHSVKMI